MNKKTFTEQIRALSKAGFRSLYEETMKLDACQDHLVKVTKGLCRGNLMFGSFALTELVDDVVVSKEGDRAKFINQFNGRQRDTFERRHQINYNW